MAPIITTRDGEHTDKRPHYRNDKDHNEGEVVGDKWGKDLVVVDHEKLKIIETDDLEDDEDFGKEVTAFEAVIQHGQEKNVVGP